MNIKHMFDVEIASEFGINAAIILENLYFWILKNKANGKHYYEGNYWTYNSISAFHELFPYLSKRQISNTLNKMVDEGILIKGNFNKVAYDRTCWYAFTKKGLSIMQKCKMEDTDLLNEFDKSDTPIPDINTDINSNINTDIYLEKSEEPKPKPKPTKKAVKHKYGQYKKVLLSDEELEKLKSEFPRNWEEWIDRVDGYCESTGKSYKNYLATIRNWAKKDLKNNPKSKPKADEFMIIEENDDLPF